MATTNTPSTLASRLKEVYADGPSVLVPAPNELFGKRLEFRKDLEFGKQTVFDVQLGNEAGFSTGVGEVTLNGAVAQTTAPAVITGYSLILQSNVSYDLITRAKDSKKAFVAFNNQKFIPAAESFRIRGEIICMGYGRQGIGKVTANNSGVLTISDDTWCSALMLNMLGATIQAWTGTGGSQHNGDLTISAISTANKTVTVTGTNSSVVANDLLFMKGHHAGGAYGLLDIAKNTGSLYSIDASTYDLWSANHYDVGTSALTLGKISMASASAADKGCSEKLTCLVPNKAFQALVNDQAALREYGANWSKNAETGFESITFWGATGPIEIVPYMFSAEGTFIMFPERYTYLIGSEEMTNQVGQGGDIYFDLESTGAKQLRFFGDWTTFCERPGYIVYGDRSDSKALHV